MSVSREKSTAVPPSDSLQWFDDQGRTKIELKLREVDNFVRTYETLNEKLFGKMYTQVVLREHEDPTPLVTSLLEAIIPLGEAGVSTSLIRKDLARVRAQLNLKKNVEDGQLLFQRIRTFALEIRNSSDSERFRVGIAEIVGRTFIFLDDAIRPAKVLREQYIQQLDHLETVATNNGDDSGKPFTVKEISKIYEIDEANVRRWCIGNEAEYRLRKVGKAWQIPRSLASKFTWPRRGEPRSSRRPSKSPKRPILPNSVKWNCQNCGNEVTAKLRPQKCKCNRPTYVRNQIKGAPTL